MAGFVVVCPAVGTPGGERGGCHPHGMAPPPITPLAGVGAPWRPLADLGIPEIFPPNSPRHEFSTHGSRRTVARWVTTARPRTQGEKR